MIMEESVKMKQQVFVRRTIADSSPSEAREVVKLQYPRRYQNMIYSRLQMSLSIVVKYLSNIFKI